MRTALGGCLGAALLWVVGGGVATAADFYEGKTISIVSGAAPGGGHDLHSRLLASYLGKYIPGNPKIIVQNMPEGRGVAAANHLYAIAKKDGTELGEFLNDAVFAPIHRQDVAKYKSEEFNWLGAPASYREDGWLLLVRSTLGYKTIEDVRNAKTPLILGDQGTVLVPLVKEGLGANTKIIPGYTGSNNTMLAFDRGEIDAIGLGYTIMARRYPDWQSKSLFQIVAQLVRLTRLPGLAEVPTGRELARTPEDLALIKYSELPLMLGYPFAAPPGVPADRVALLRQAFKATMEDAEYRAALDKAQLEYSPKSGNELVADIREANSASPAVIARFRQISGQ